MHTYKFCKIFWNLTFNKAVKVDDVWRMEWNWDMMLDDIQVEVDGWAEPERSP